MTTTAWGSASVVEEISIKQSATDDDGEKKEFATLVQLLEDGEGNLLVRFAYSTANGEGQHVARRGPVTLRASDLEKLKKAAEKRPKLRAALFWPP